MESKEKEGLFSVFDQLHVWDHWAYFFQSKNHISNEDKDLRQVDYVPRVFSVELDSFQFYLKKFKQQEK